MMEPSTTAIENELTTFLSSAYSELFREYIFFIAAMLISCIVIPIFVVWMFNKYDRKFIQAGSPCKAYTHRNTTPLTIHMAVVFMMPILAVRELYYCLRLTEQMELYGVELIVFCVFLLLLAVLATVGLFKFRIFGLFSMGAFLFCFAACKQYKNLLAVAADLRDQTQCTTIGQYTLYIVHDYIVTQSMAISFVVFAALTMLAIYYYKRRFLFMPRKLSVPSCEYCGQVISRGNNFCTCCGKQLQLNPLRQIIMPLDKQLYCGKCGKFTNGSACVTCSKTVVGYVKKAAREKADEVKKSLPRNLLLAVAIIIIILLSVGSLTTDLQNGSARANNAFVERCNEFYDNPDCASDHEWLIGFDSAAEALYQLDARWCSVSPRSVRSSCLAFFMVYADASFQQMEVLEQKVENVHNAAHSKMTTDEIHTEFATLQNKFNQTIDLQTSSMTYYGSVSSQMDLLGKFGYLCFDALRALLPWVNTVLVSIVFMAGCALMFVYMLNGFSNTTITKFEQRLQKSRTTAETRNSKYTLTPFTTAPADLLHRTAVAAKSCWFCLIRIANELWLLILHLIGMIGLFFLLFRWKNISSFVRWVKAGLTDVKGVHTAPSPAYKREQRLASVIAVIIVVVIFGISGFCVNTLRSLTGDSSNEREYLFAAKAATSDYAVDISKVLLNIRSTGTLTEEDRAHFYDLIDLQIEADEAILAYDMTNLDDYQTLHNGLQSLCRDDIMALQRIKDAIEDGLIPSQELQRNYHGLRSENYLWVIEDVALKFTKLATMTAFE